ncbi:hypothetical protein BATDEDRAFT_84675 [Batrachochytrium dendrobatidis JAM81]|uniref:sn-1-specific diacylglycerol lipase n=2 Tax=Batrachochytrium dendrobatidis TaxID=109871 RepID=F4NTZ8_BATDJ|nr:uncharacterized protein BATDEDRAFT_84675 [Batrachochytrium dendrobatidis JAM81]EGF83960.1 hypothetical protein BATDEDRAFT_84675 [Batrachochytrium dendrobatidis JAM81]|eukprot:XP_006676292.1 hypothetical protein BATDEDRAFT_84675 [Batrachochytrium dendrobatidis JAM81]
MGRLVFFNRRLPISADDLYLPVLYLVILRTLWTPATAFVYYLVNDNCSWTWLVRLYVFIGMCIGIIIWVNESVICFLSTRGTIVKKEPRKAISPLCHIDFILVILDFGCQIFGAYSTYGLPIQTEEVTKECHTPLPLYSIYILHIVIIWGIITSIGYFTIVGLFIYSSRKKRSRDINMAKYMRLWQRRIQWLCSGPHNRKREGQKAILNVSRELADYFKDVDWSPSDIAVGLILLKREQKMAREAAEVKQALPGSSFCINSTQPEGIRSMSSFSGSSILAGAGGGSQVHHLQLQKSQQHLQYLQHQQQAMQGQLKPKQLPTLVETSLNSVAAESSQGLSESMNQPASVKSNHPWGGISKTKVSSSFPQLNTTQGPSENNLHSNSGHMEGYSESSDGSLSVKRKMSFPFTATTQPDKYVTIEMTTSHRSPETPVSALPVDQPAFSDSTMPSKLNCSLNSSGRADRIVNIELSETPTLETPPNSNSATSENTTDARILKSNMSALDSNTEKKELSTNSLEKSVQSTTLTHPHTLEISIDSSEESMHVVEEKLNTIEFSANNLDVELQPKPGACMINTKKSMISARASSDYGGNLRKSIDMDSSVSNVTDSTGRTTRPLVREIPASNDRKSHERRLGYSPERRPAGLSVPLQHAVLSRAALSTPSVAISSPHSRWPRASETAAVSATQQLPGSMTNISIDGHKRMSIASETSSRRMSLATDFRSYEYYTAHRSRPGQTYILKEDIQDILHFAHYAELVYINFDSTAYYNKIDVLIHVSPKNDLYMSPYMISFDHEWRAIVVSIRGTYSAADVLVDLSIDLDVLEPYQDEESGRIMFVHSGILGTAKNIYNEIIADQHLANILLDENSAYADYGIVVCGHSLGAGVGALVAYFLRKAGYLSTICYAYEPPGGLISEEAVPIFESFCVSIVTGDDLVPRLCRNSMDILKADVDRLINVCDLPKHRIFGSVLFNACSGPSEKTKFIINRLRRRHGVDVTESHADQLKQIRKQTRSLPFAWRQDSSEGMNTDGGSIERTCPPMFVPGRILYIEKLRGFSAKYSNPAVPRDQLPDNQRRRTTRRKPGNASLMAIKRTISTQIDHIKQRTKDLKYIYVPRWADKTEFLYMIISRSMMTDHSPFGILREFDDSALHIPLQTTS